MGFVGGVMIAIMALSTAFTELFSVQHPIALAPMGGSAGGALAAAVSNGGGLGLLGGGNGDVGWPQRTGQVAPHSVDDHEFGARDGRCGCPPTADVAHGIGGGNTITWQLDIHLIDVGQGDCTLVVARDPAGNGGGRPSTAVADRRTLVEHGRVIGPSLQSPPSRRRLLRWGCAWRELGRRRRK